MESIFILIAFAIGAVIGALVAWWAKNRELKSVRYHADAQRQEIQKQIEYERENFKSLLQSAQQNWQMQMDVLRKDILAESAKTAMANTQHLQSANAQNLDELLKPLKLQFEAFVKSIDDTRTQNAVSRKSIEDTFQSAIKIFQAQQDAAIKQLRDETAKIGNDAVALTKALTNDSKKQGNWGEMVLETLLENSGLEKDVHFYTQYNVQDAAGKRYIPDVVLKFPEGRSLIIDSKVSLTAYASAFETDDDEKRDELLQAHLASVEKHVKELGEKKYQRLVGDSMDFVMMFVPNESSYIAAVRLNPNLITEAYEKKVLIVSPNNLMMALALAYNMWQNDKQLRNIEKIVDRATHLYEKVELFQRSFKEMDDCISKLKNTYDKALSQLSTGPGNVLRQCEMLREYGVKVEKKIEE